MVGYWYLGEEEISKDQIYEKQKIREKQKELGDKEDGKERGGRLSKIFYYLFLRFVVNLLFGNFECIFYRMNIINGGQGFRLVLQRFIYIILCLMYCVIIFNYYV